MYNPYPATYQPSYQQPSYQQPQTNSNMIWVQGESGAKAHPTSPNVSQALFDSERQVFYVKSVDQSGMPQPLRVFRYEECSEAEDKSSLDLSNYITRDEFDALKQEMSKLKSKPQTNDRRNNNGKSIIPRANV